MALETQPATLNMLETMHGTRSSASTQDARSHAWFLKRSQQSTCSKLCMVLGTQTALDTFKVVNGTENQPALNMLEAMQGAGNLASTQQARNKTWY